MKRKISYIGGDVDDDDNYEIELSAEAIDETNSNLKLGVDVIKEISNIGAKVDKQNEVIQLINSKENDNSEKIAEIEITNDNITSSVTSVEEKLNEVGEAIETINSTMMKQTSEAFEMLFTQTGIEDTVNTIQNMLNDNTTDINTISQYIHFEGGIITLGASDSQSKLIIQKDKISFMTGDSESAYISQNQLYITDSTILRKLQVGRWITQEDEYGNLNTKWVGGE